ncbi:MAG TPA: lysylphosphatidylglycerol synthase transmembrane domain-containing protein [Gaiellaceae bacterium]|nr:lysylphosphatidylglycerol synthase transmembrane domain-containing protein [Gaiellaceae bacterium]
MTRSRALRIVLTLAVTGACLTYLLWKLDIRRTAHILVHANLGWFVGAVLVSAAGVPPMAWRWQRLLAARGVREGLPWLNRAYFVSYTAGQVLPTAVGGDASRVYETARRHPGRLGDLTAIVLLERALGGVATLLLAAVGFALAIGRYDVGAYIWIELAFVVGTIVLAVLFFARGARGPLRRFVPLLRRLRVERPLRALYDGVHAFRRHAGLMAAVLVLTLGVQAYRVLAIWMTGRAIGVDLSPRPYYVMGPLLFLVMLVPFTINGLAVREAFFVSFLTQLGVDKEAAFATGFLFFVATIVLALPGAVVLAVENLRGLAPAARARRT